MLIRFFFDPSNEENENIFCLRARGENYYNKLL